MPSDPIHVPSPIDSEARFEVTAPHTITPVAIALVAIIGAGLIGLYRGVESVREATAGSSGSPTTGAIVGAQPATALPRNPDWSTLSGPVVLPPPAPKVQKAEQDTDSGDEAEADESQAAQSVDAETATPTPAPMVTAPPVITGPLSSAPPRG